ncbi:transcriptional regulator [Streptomyces bambusae]|uniref:transcriptional regulator n=1 Tax=Streptomyces bambusae TaxID=1550616 RepID=UPI001CFFA683|nr:transcriptional regulator [Streptomyces bambusae]MCB5169457.1 transcriptional regulator [Streptomyces bambusae]
MSTEGHALEVDDVVHQRTRLSILSLLNEVGSAEFTYVRDTLDLTDGNLGRHVEVLTGRGLVTCERRPALGGRTRMWVTITREGRAAFGAEIEALRRLVQRYDAPRG